MADSMTHNNHKKSVYSARHGRLVFIIVLWLAILMGCQPIESTTVSPSSTALPPATIEALTPFALTGSAVTCTPAPISPTPTRTPTPILSDQDHPIALIGTIIDGTGAQPLEDAILLLQHGRIVAVGPRENVEIPSDAIIMAFQDATIMPGFINAHVHNAYEPALLKKWAQAGVTTVRDLGARYPFFRFSTRDQNNQDPFLATTISAGPLITVPGGYPIVGANFPSLAVTSADHARREVAQLIKDGADVIKIVVDSGEGWPTLSLEKAAAIVETAHQRGMPVSAHISSLGDLRLVVEAGVDDFSHIVPEKIPGDVLQQMVNQGISWVPTLEPAHGYEAGNLRAFIDVGGRVALGNDGGMLPGIEIGMPMREIEWMEAAGMTPMEIILAATRNAAQVCNREDSLGTLEVGKIADILVVSGNPLEDLQTLRQVRLVIHHGVVIRDSD